jgi:hypothetical protein
LKRSGGETRIGSVVPAVIIAIAGRVKSRFLFSDGTEPQAGAFIELPGAERDPGAEL